MDMDVYNFGIKNLTETAIEILSVTALKLDGTEPILMTENEITNCENTPVKFDVVVINNGEAMDAFDIVMYENPLELERQGSILPSLMEGTITLDNGGVGYPVADGETRNFTVTSE